MGNFAVSPLFCSFAWAVALYSICYSFMPYTPILEFLHSFTQYKTSQHFLNELTF